MKHFDVVITSTKRQRVDLPKCPRIHSLALRACNVPAKKGVNGVECHQVPPVRPYEFS